MRTVSVRIAAAAVFLVTIVATYAHGPLDERLAAATQSIATSPQRPELYLSRASLHLEHNDFAAAAADLTRAEQLGAPPLATILLRSRSLSARGRDAAALKLIDSGPTALAEDPQMQLGRADVLERLGRYREASQSLGLALAKLDRGHADLYLRRAQLLTLSGDHAAAQECLIQGCRSNDDPVALRAALCESYAASGEPAAALQVLAGLIAAAPRKERWLVRKAEVLRTMGRAADAEDAARAALRAIESLPPRHRQAPAMRELEQKVRASLKVAP